MFLRQFLDDTIEALPARNFSRDIFRADAAFRPNDAEMIKKVDTFQNDVVVLLLHRVETDFYSLLRELLCHLGDTVRKKL
jgi:hypothetical protein